LHRPELTIMAEPKMAPIQILSEDKELARIEPADIMRVLMIEDDVSVRDSTVRRLEEAGYRVDSYTTPREAAAIIEPDKYQLVIVDIRFDAPNISGDEFVFKNRDALDDAKIVAFTGYEDDIVHEQVFDQVFLKGKSKSDLFEFAEETYRDRQRAIATKIQNDLTRSTDEVTANSEKPKEELIKILSQTKDKDKKILWYKGRDFSAEELMEEVQDPTSDVGKSHLRMMVDWLARRKRDH
jgi:CheY-like chemotaxis protein